jgi:cbb3-type cytochrome oxidase maturation protein
VACWYWHGGQFALSRRQCHAATENLTKARHMDILYLLVPLSVMLVFFILAGLWWAVYRGQFEDLEGEGERILHTDA